MTHGKLKRAHGNWVSGDTFWDREAELELFEGYLEEGAHLLLVAQRRIGKTSLMRETARRLKDRFYCLYVDLEKCRSAADAVVELSIATLPHGSLWAKTKALFANALKSAAERIEELQIAEIAVSLRSGLHHGNWQAKGDHLFSTLANADKPVVIFFDEVPILVNRILKGDTFEITPERREEADTFLSWLRANCGRHQGLIRVVVTGSIGLEPVVRQAGLSATLNTFTRFKLEPWDRETAAGALRALARGNDLELKPEVIDKLLDHLGLYIPHHVQMFFDRLYAKCKLDGIAAPTPGLVTEVYQHSMLSVHGHAELSHLEERLKMVLGPELHPLALALLTEAAVIGKLNAEAATALARRELELENPDASEIRKLLEILEHDGYLRREGTHGYRFVSKLLEDWWKARFSFGYTSPILDEAR